MPGTGSGSLKFLAREPVIFSIFLLPQTWLVQGSGCFGQTRRQWKPAGVTQKVSNLSCQCLLLWSKVYVVVRALEGIDLGDKRLIYYHSNESHRVVLSLGNIHCTWWF